MQLHCVINQLSYAATCDKKAAISRCKRDPDNMFWNVTH